MLLKNIKLDHDFNYFLKEDYYKVGEHSCIIHQKTDNPKLYDEMGGMPKSYVLENTTIYQLWFEDIYLKRELGKKLGVDVVSVSSIMQPCGPSIPMHVDHFHKIRISYPDDKRTRVRANIFLEDWEPGHILHYQVNNEWFTSSPWNAGEGYMWDSEVMHLSGNSGMVPKYTLQVSGFLVN